MSIESLESEPTVRGRKSSGIVVVTRLDVQHHPSDPKPQLKAVSGIGKATFQVAIFRDDVKPLMPSHEAQAGREEKQNSRDKQQQSR